MPQVSVLVTRHIEKGHSRRVGRASPEREAGGAWSRFLVRLASPDPLVGTVCSRREATGWASVQCESCGHVQSAGRFCGRCGARLRQDLPTAGNGSPLRPSEVPAGPARSGWGAAGKWAAFAAVAVVVAFGAFVLLRDGAESPGRVAVPSPSRPASSSASAATLEPTGFSSPTATTLIVDNGNSGATAVDLDSGERADLELPGQQPGDPPYRLHQMGDLLVYGGGEIWAYDPASGGSPRLIGEATVFLPAAEPDRLWLIDYPGGRIGQGAPTWRLVDLQGRTLHEGGGSVSAMPVRGVPGGLALAGSDGSLLRYHIGTRQIADYVGQAGAHLLDVTPHLVAWCEVECRTVEVTDAIRSGTYAQLGAGDVVRFAPDGVWLSPDGARLAAHVEFPDERGAVTYEMRTYDLRRSGIETVQRGIPPGPTHGAWSAGDQFFYWIHDRHQSGTDSRPLLGRYVVGQPQFETARLDPEGDALHRFVTLPTDTVATLLDPRCVAPAGTQPPAATAAVRRRSAPIH